MIAPVTVEEIETLGTELGDSFYSECHLPGGFKKEVFIHNWNLLLKGNIGAMWRLVLDNSSVGFLGAILMPDVNNGDLVATEMFWYVSPSYRKSMWGIRLLTTFEKWAKEIGAKRVVMAHLTNPEGEVLGKFYTRKGYTLTESHYVKEL